MRDIAWGFFLGLFGAFGAPVPAWLTRWLSPSEPRPLRNIGVVTVRGKRVSFRLVETPMPTCVCGHSLARHQPMPSVHAPPYGLHNPRLVMGCTEEGCACGPGCIHEGFVDRDYYKRTGDPS